MSQNHLVLRTMNITALKLFGDDFFILYFCILLKEIEGFLRRGNNQAEEVLTL